MRGEKRSPGGLHMRGEKRSPGGLHMRGEKRSPGGLHLMKGISFIGASRTHKEKRHRRGLHLFEGSVLRRLTGSYVILITALALVIGVSAHTISSRNYNRQVAELNQRLLNRYATILNDNLIEEAQRVHQDLCLNLTLKTSLEVLFEPEYDIVKVKRLHGELLKIVSASEGRIEAIHIRSLPNDFHISSMMGFKDNSEINRRMLPNLYWSANADQLSERAIWMPTRTLHYSTVDQVNVVSYVATYPSTQPFSRAKGIITIDLREDYVREVLGKVSSEDARRFFITDMDGNLITSGTENIAGSLADLGFSNPELLLQEDWTDRVLRLPDGKHMTSRIRLSNGWMLFQTMPLSAFSAVSRSIALLNLLLSLAAVLSALVLARRFAHRIHRPLAHITERLQALMQLGDRDEYAILDRAVIEMQEQMVALTGMRESSLSLVREKLLRGLVDGTLRPGREYTQWMARLGWDTGKIGPHVRVLLVDWAVRRTGGDREAEMPASNGEDRRAEIPTGNGEDRRVEIPTGNGEDRRVEIPAGIGEEQVNGFLAGVTGKMRGMSGGPVLLGAQTHAAPVTMLLLSERPIQDIPTSVLLAEAGKWFGSHVCLSLGDLRESPFQARASAQSAELALAERFFHPEQSVFPMEAAVPDVQAVEEEPARWLSRYVDCLKTNQEEAAAHCIEVLAMWAKTSARPAEERWKVLWEGMKALLGFAGDIQVSVPHVSIDGEPTVWDSFGGYADVEAFLSDWRQATADLLERKQQAVSKGSEDVVAFIKQHVASHLAEDLSLTRLSGLTGLSNNYLSHLFKEATGVNLLHHITDCRMEAARQLLTSGSLTVEAIARKLGFETPHYFSRKFRQYYGCTPSAYRLEQSEAFSGKGTVLDA